MVGKALFLHENQYNRRTGQFLVEVRRQKTMTLSCTRSALRKMKGHAIPLGQEYTGWSKSEETEEF